MPHTKPPTKTRWTPARRIAAGAALVLLTLPLLVVLFRPTGESAPFVVADPADGPTEVFVDVSVENLDASRGLLRVRVTAGRAPATPAAGLLVVVGSDGVDVLTVKPDDIGATASTEIRLTDAAVEGYPFDSYRVDIPVHTFEPGTDGEPPQPRPASGIDLVGDARIPGFKITGDIRDVDEPLPGKALRLQAQRNDSVVLWATLMMVIYWSMAVLAVATVLADLTEKRTFVWTQMSWMGAMMFAMVAFRNAAPGNPPIGVWFDYAAFFPAEAFMALSILMLGSYFLLAKRSTLKV